MTRRPHARPRRPSSLPARVAFALISAWPLRAWWHLPGPAREWWVREYQRRHPQAPRRLHGVHDD